MISVWALIPAVIIGTIIGAIIMGFYLLDGGERNDRKRKWWDDE